MDWTEGVQKAIEYIEENLAEELDYEEIAAQSYFSRYHFHRLFGAFFGYTVGEYIRNRRLTVAGRELVQGKAKVIDVALKYGYDNPDSFAKAFFRFHGVLPSKAKRNPTALRSFPKITFPIQKAGGRVEMKYKIEERQGLVLVGYKRRFSGVPYGKERAKQEKEFFCATRAKQWLLRGASATPETEYCIVGNVDEDGYDFYIAYAVDEWERNALFDPKITGVHGLESWGLETIEIPAQKYAIFETERQHRPILEYVTLRERIMTEWLPSSAYRLAKSPELIVLRWSYLTDRENKYVEVCIPIE